MEDSSAHIYGELSDWPTKRHLAQIFRDAGLRVVVGTYSIRIQDCAHFCFQDYGGDSGSPQIDADADSVAEMQKNAQIVSAALTQARIRHRFELYDSRNEMVGYIHHNWHLVE